MRIWSIHPKHLDAKGLVALWRETLLAKNVLEGKTKGYRNHPQLARFKKVDDPVGAICQYLSLVYDEAVARGYNFNKDKFDAGFNAISIPVTQGQVEYETAHLLRKLVARDTERFTRVKNESMLSVHPMFVVVAGDVEDWEVREETTTVAD